MLLQEAYWVGDVAVLAAPIRLPIPCLRLRCVSRMGISVFMPSCGKASIYVRYDLKYIRGRRDGVATFITICQGKV